MKDLVKKAKLDDKFYIASRATSIEELGNDMHHGTKNELRKHGIEFSPRHATQITKDDYTNFDLLVCMDENNICNLTRIIGDDKDKKVYLLLEFCHYENEKKMANLQIADPWYSGDFARTFAEISQGCKALFDKFTNL